MRAADLYFRELVVPGLGRIWFARQIAWPLAALAVHEDLAKHSSNAPKPTAIAHGIEALACKLEYLVDPRAPSSRILGRRAFGRDAEREVWSFQRLRQATHYVRNTHRQAATRALRVSGGLGFASGPRFDLLELEPVGRAMVDAFLAQRVGQGGTSLRKWLLGWLRGDHEVPRGSKSLWNALSPEHPTDSERALVRSRLLGTFTPASEKRQRLACAVGSAIALRPIEDEVVVRLRDAGHPQQADEVVAARAFGAVLDRARDVIANLTQVVEPARGGVRLTRLTAGSALSKSIKSLRNASNNYLAKAKTAGVEEATSRSFADAVVAGDDAAAIRMLVLRSADLLALADSAVIRGPLFRIVEGTGEASDLEDGTATIEPDRTGRTFRIANFHSMLRDVTPRGHG